MPKLLPNSRTSSDTMTEPKLRSDLLEWKALEAHKTRMDHVQIKDLFKRNPIRFDEFHLRHEGLLLDYSKQRVTEETIKKLLDYAYACDVEGWRDRMFSGDLINTSENRAVLHTALRNKYLENLIVDGINIVPPMRAVFERMKNFSNTVRADKKFKHIVNIGIGGSDLGASMICEALKSFTDPDIKTYFISNVDPAYILDIFEAIDPQTTLFIVTSKTFTTHETIVNAITAHKWIQKALGTTDVANHFVAITQNTDEARKFGVPEDQIFRVWDWVGGRYSLWSSIGLSFCLSIGFDNFCKLLDGAHSMDKHFRSTPLNRNMPVLLALIGMWNRNFLKYPTLAIISYSQYMHRVPAYMQQLDMESNGKTVDREGRKIPYETGPIILGETGTNGQHAFFQLIHQGSTIVPVDFIAAIKPQRELDENMTQHQNILLANMIAQGKALMDGRITPQAHKSFEGNRPSNAILLDTLDPYHLGMLLALYEHKIFVQGILWNINSFDQFGVELGKRLTSQVMEYLKQDQNANEMAPSNLDSSTSNLITCILKK